MRLCEGEHADRGSLPEGGLFQRFKYQARSNLKWRGVHSNGRSVAKYLIRTGSRPCIVRALYKISIGPTFQHLSICGSVGRLPSFTSLCTVARVFVLDAIAWI